MDLFEEYLNSYATPWIDHYKNVINGKEKATDDFEKEITDAAKSYNKVINGESDEPEVDLDEALQHIKKACDCQNCSKLKEVLWDAPNKLEELIKEELGKLNDGPI